MSVLVNSLIIVAAGAGLLFVSRLISKGHDRRLRGSEAMDVTVVNKETIWTDGGGTHVIYVGNPACGLENVGKAAGVIEVDRKTFESTRRGDEIQVFRHPRTGEILHLSADHEFAFVILIIGWLIAGGGVLIAVVNLIESLAE